MRFEGLGLRGWGLGFSHLGEARDGRRALFERVVSLREHLPHLPGESLYKQLLRVQERFRRSICANTSRTWCRRGGAQEIERVEG